MENEITRAVIGGILLNIIGLKIGFWIGALWIQTKEAKFGKKANYNCPKCQAIGCQAKWCLNKTK